MSQPAAKKQKTGASGLLGTKITDSRFKNIQSDPRYKLPGRKQKIKVDSRFAKALKDEDFSRKAKVDRYGRPVDADSEKSRLKRKYEFEEDVESSPSESDEPDDDDEVQAELERVAGARDFLREGKAASSSEEDSSSDDDSDEEELDEEVDEAGPGLQDRDVPMGEVSSRLAVVNIDWDNIRAEDLLAVFQSFLPATGRLLKVAVYPSEFGKERIAREELEGPPKEIFARRDEDDVLDSESEDDEDIKNSIIKPDDGSEFDSGALRQYQLERLRYYYAVLTFTDPQTAKAIYDSVDGREYLSTANFFDLRFIPDDTDFSDDIPREECERLPSNYKPNEFVTDALQHSKVKLTWDADDTTRKEAQARAFRRGRKDIDEDDLKAYLATDSESEEEEEVPAAESNTTKKEAERQRMRALLGLAPEPVKKPSKDKKSAPLGNIQITFSSGLSGLNGNPEGSSDEDNTNSKSKKKRNVFENSPEPNETTVEKYIRKEKERKQRRKDKMKADRNGTTEDLSDQEQENPESTKENTTTDPDAGFNDPFFAEATHDPTTATKQRKADRLKRRTEREAEEAASAKERAALELLMADDNNTATTAAGKGRTVRHFDMSSIEKAEKALSKKTNKKKSKSKTVGSRHEDPEKVLASDTFTMDTADPRFAGVYEDHAFAIDPTNPRFKGTRGMKTLLEEGRRRKNKDKGNPKDESKGAEKSANRDGGNSKRVESEVMGLAEKIKRRSKNK